MYIKIFQCRLCQSLIEKEIIDDVKANIEFVNVSEHEQTIRHYCDNGDMGIAELIGLKKVQKVIELIKDNKLDT